MPEPPLSESPVDEPLLPPQAVTATARPARPIPASAARLGQAGWDSCVTVFLRDLWALPYASVVRITGRPGSALSPLISGR